MAINCPQCGAQFDVTLFQFGHVVQCDCGAWVALEQGHLRVVPVEEKDDQPRKPPVESP